MSFRYPYAKIFIALMIIFGLCACHEEVKIEEDATDQMDSDKFEGDIRHIFPMDDKVYMIDPAYAIDFPYGELKEGCFYEIKADITYLNGGVAGYVDYPEIDRLIDCKEISPFDLKLADITEKRYGLLFIGDYAEGDIFLNEYNKAALWMDGQWIWQYDKKTEREDGTFVCYVKDVDMDTIEKGISEGVLACKEYFVLPAIKAE